MVSISPHSHSQKLTRGRDFQLFPWRFTKKRIDKLDMINMDMHKKEINDNRCNYVGDKSSQRVRMKRTKTLIRTVD